MNMNNSSDSDVSLEQNEISQTELNGNLPQNSALYKTDELSSTLSEYNLNEDTYTDDESYSAPVEILAEFLSTLMSRDYKSALYYCKLILQYEPDNKTVQDFYPLILKRINFVDNSESEEGSCYTSKSENSTEYFSSTSFGTENMSACSSFSSEEEELSLDHSQ